MTTQKRLRILEELFSQRVDRHIADVLPLFLARYHGDELRQVAALLKRVAGSDHDATAATAGAGLLAVWRGELSMERWAAMWLLADVRESIDAALATLSPTQRKS